jgi:PAS domain S-box-containing protein
MENNRHLRVLLIDDDKEEYIIIRDLLEDLPGNTVAIEWEGQYDRAKQVIARGDYDAYLVDYRLGAQTGIDLLAELGQESASIKPIILLTGKGDHEVDMKAMQSGAADYLVKNQLSAPLLERSIRYAVRRAEYILELKRREDAAREIFDATFEGILVVDLSGKILDLNRPAARSLGEVQANLRGKSIFSFFSIETSNRLLAAAHEAAPKTFKAVCTSAKGTSVHLEVSTKSYSFLGQPAILLACEDISERLQMEAQILQQDRLASVGLLASSLAHEIGTPLGVMRGRAEIILMHADVTTAPGKNASIIITQIDRISKLIHSLLNLARGEKTQSEGKVDIARVVDDVLDLMGHELAKNKIEIKNLLEPNCWVRAVSGQLHQVLLNLMVNAMHAIQSASKQGRNTGHQIRLSAIDEGSRWKLNIEDTGCGISEANMKQIFKPFFTTKDIGVGTGLGLATSYRLLEAWDASISVQSRENVGTTFTINLLKA